MGNSTEQFGFKVGLQNAEEKEPCNLSIMTLERVYKIIESKSFEPKLTVEMKRVIDVMKPGSLIMFKNIICRNAKGDLLPPMNVRIFLDEKKIYQYGF